MSEQNVMQVFRHFPEQAELPVALAIGNFDGVHLGHLAVLRQLKDAAARLGVASCVMIFEPHPREFFHPQQAPVRLASLREKLEQFEAAGINRVHVCHFDAAFAAMTAEDFARNILHRALDVRYVIVGDDFCFGAERRGTLEMLQRFGDELGFEVQVLSPVKLDGLRVSSTSIRNALATGDLELARQLLGRPYSISGHVVHGDKLGRELGYPTANIHMPHDHSSTDKPPLTGIYAVKLAGVDTVPLPGVASLGVRPTVKEHGRVTLEVHLFDFDRDIYGQHVQVQFLKKIRDEEKLPDLEALKRKIADDERAAREFFDRCA